MLDRVLVDCTQDPGPDLDEIAGRVTSLPSQRLGVMVIIATGAQLEADGSRAHSSARSKST